MNDALGLVIGLALGVSSTITLRRQTLTAMGSGGFSISNLAVGAVVRLGAAVAVLVLLLTLVGAGAALSAIFGYWLGRTSYLLHSHADLRTPGRL